MHGLDEEKKTEDDIPRRSMCVLYAHTHVCGYGRRFADYGLGSQEGWLANMYTWLRVSSGLMQHTTSFLHSNWLLFSDIYACSQSHRAFHRN